jgi:energy-coupling factor transporter ATP-binding protein EcfA2
MKLTSLSITNFRCFASLPDIPVHQLTLFIGENDSGKTALIDAVELLLTARAAVTTDFRKVDDELAAELIIEGRFSLESSDTLPTEFSQDGQTLILRKVCNAGGTVTEIQGLGFEDPRWNSFETQTATIQRELLGSVGIEPGSNNSSRSEQFKAAVNENRLPRVPATLPVQFGRIAEHLPRFERVSSIDYRQPDSMVQRVMQGVVDNCLRPTNASGERELLAELQTVGERIRSALNEKAREMREILTRHNPKITNIEVSPVIDFAKAVLATSVHLDTGEGLRPVSRFGEGSKKKLWMGLLDWERQTQLELGDSMTIRAYDEPDVNLDYAAERQLFSTILRTTQNEDSRSQALVCTHAMTFVDRAPARSINHINVISDGSRKIEWVNGGDDADIRAFLQGIGQSVGLSNSALFYERAFLVVEGESEENALPLLYRNLFSRTMIEDGIVLINLYTCSAWKGILKVLLNQRAHLTVMLLDQDCTQPTSSGCITSTSLTEVGYPAEFLGDSCFYVGAKEFEDAFRTEDIVAVLDTRWPLENGQWSVATIDTLKATATKFGDELIRSIRQTCQPIYRSSARKPALATCLGQYCVTAERIPSAIQNAFTAVRRKAAVE